MKKKTVRRAHKQRVAKAVRPSPEYLIFIKGWTFVVALALMLGLGTVIGEYLSTQLYQSAPQVAGVQTEVR